MKKYGWKNGAETRGLDAQVVGSFLEDLEGREVDLTPQLILKKAQAKASPLHGYFDWDDTEAARKWRIRQAGKLVGSIEVTVVIKSQPPTHVRAFVRVGPDATAERTTGRYVSLGRAMKDSDMRSDVLRDAVREMQAFRLKYAHLVELLDVFNMIDKVLEKVE